MGTCGAGGRLWNLEAPCVPPLPSSGSWHGRGHHTACEEGAERCPGWLGRDWVKSAPSWPPGPPPGLLPMLSAKPSARGSDSGVDGPSGEQGPWRGRACLSGQSCGASGTPVPGVGDPSAGLSQCCPHPWGHGVPRAHPPKGPLTQERCCGCELLLSMNATC